MVLIFGSSASDKEGTLPFRQRNEFRFIMSPLNHKMEPHEPADYKLLSTKEGMFINNIF